MPLDIIPSGRCLGAEVRGVNLSKPLDAATFAAIHEAWLAHVVLLFREQNLDDEALVAFTRYFGEPQASPRSEVSESL